MRGLAGVIWSRLMLVVPALTCAAMAVSGEVDLQGLAAAGSTATGVRSDTFTEGFDKSTIGTDRPAARLALRGEIAWAGGDFRAATVVDADSQRSQTLDIQEAWIAWNPVPTSPWRIRGKAGAYFPQASLETSYEQFDWKPERTLSGSAIHSWISEELRIIGAELALQWRGVMAGSPHQIGGRLGAFGWNDPAGTQVAWRGWNLGARATGLSQRLRLPDLAVYRPDGPIAVQTRNVQLFREIDDRPGFYGALDYGYEGLFDVEVFRYDNRGDPQALVDGQYSWRTRFDLVALRLHLPADVELLAQSLDGDTLMGPRAVQVDFSAWYLLASRRLGPGDMTVRHDRFSTAEDDVLPDDVNGERGHAWAIAYRMPVSRSATIVAEWLRVRSNRPARAELGAPVRKLEDQLGFELRWVF